MMPRRRSRYVLLVAFVMAFMLYQVFKNPEWDTTNYTGSFKPSVPDKGQNAPAKPPPVNDPAVNKPLNNNPPPDSEHPHDQEEDEPEQNPQKQTAKQTVKIPQLKTETSLAKEKGIPTKSVNTPTMPVYDPENPAQVTKAATTTALEDDIHAKKPPGRPNPEYAAQSSSTSTSQIHWHKVSEHFPVPTEDIIPLPTGKPKDIPKIQYKFAPESDVAKEKREKRLAQVKAEMQRSWGGYRKYAWMHDELSPVTARFRDPFCGWAATLVDGLDTLWIMGMKDEFDEAAKAVKNIDFTYSPTRRDIPVFETIIRYLGGLLAAYDVSGGKQGGYDMLLDKATELAEILMGVFDTPNRMPILYYNWQPQYASQPHRATTVGVAELGSMTMEFTRLAQLTGKDKYYDAIARITDALEDLQDRGTTIDGIFPEQLDASGCNRTAEAILYQEAQAAAASASAAAVLAAAGEPKGHQPAGEAKRDEADAVLPRETSLSQSRTAKDDSRNVVAKRAVAVSEDGDSIVKNVDISKKETVPEPKVNEQPLYPGNSGRRPSPTTPEVKKSDFDCIKQGLAPGGWGYEQYSMGGSQDSTYEYFPKEYLVLGGLEPKYRKMHVKTIEAVKKWLLYRPMVPDERDILFSAKVSTSGDPENDLRTEYEVTHLTCFIGGMFGLGAKIFDRPEDLEIAKRLTDGCVWAYESMPSGIMPEGASVVPCASTKSCPWNETLWWEHLDPSAAWRDQQVEEWEERQRNKKQEELRRETPQESSSAKTDADADKPAAEKADPLADVHVPQDEPKAVNEVKKTEWPAPEPGLNKSPSNVDEHLLRKREAAPPPVDRYHKTADGTRITADDPRKGTSDEVASNSLKDKLNLNSEDNSASSSSADAPVSGGVVSQIPAFEEYPDPKPLSHEEFIAAKLKNEKIPPGFVNINARRYILRPEAIESVWYMYRITGDPIWQEKGWKMWEAVIKATRTEHGASAIDDILSEKPEPVDEMESFWVAETLKYFYLLFTTPDVVSLDDWVLNTEAHPFKRPV